MFGCRELWMIWSTLRPLVGPCSCSSGNGVIEYNCTEGHAAALQVTGLYRVQLYRGPCSCSSGNGVIEYNCTEGHAAALQVTSYTYSGIPIPLFC